MSYIITDFGRLEYEPTWLEQKLEEYLLSENNIYLPPARKMDMHNFPRRVDFCRHIIASHFPFEAVIYSKALASNNMNSKSVPTWMDITERLAESLEDPECLQEEMIRFALSDGIVTLRHRHKYRRECEDDAFSVRWGGGDLSTCPCVALDEKRRYDMEGSVLGRKECLHALDTVIKGGGLHLEY